MKVTWQSYFYSLLSPGRIQTEEARKKRGTDKVIKAKNIMTKNVITVSPETGITKVAKLLLDHSINGIPVVDREDRLVGIICQSDLIVQQKKFPLPSVFTILDGTIPLVSPRHFEKEIEKMAASTVDQAMTRNPITLSPESSIEEIATLMTDKKIHTLPVLDQGKLVGIVGKEDILASLLARKE